MEKVQHSKLITFPEKREEFEKIIGFDYIRAQLSPKTPFGKRYFQHIQSLKGEHLIGQLQDTQYIIQILEKNTKLCEAVENTLECIVDISQTVRRLETGEVVDEIELFELKNFVLTVQSLREKLLGFLDDKFIPPNLEDVLNLLDPEGLRMPTFYIYDLYDERLKEIRKKKRELNKIHSEKDDPEGSEMEIALENEERQIEKQVIERISENLSQKATELRNAIEKVRYLDVILAKAKLAVELGLSMPSICTQEIEDARRLVICDMFNPILKEKLVAGGKRYQPVSIEIEKGVTLIVGANMSGKSVVLRTVALIQYMAQLGFFVPARVCETVYFDTIAIVTEDTQRPLSGLSSFAAEIKAIDEIYCKVKENSMNSLNSLIMIDEPARTTNPHEGTAIVNAIVELFESVECYALIVSHFDGINAKRRLRVKGLKSDVQLSGATINIQDYIDYQLIKVEGDEVPKEAIRVMELLKINDEFVNKAKEKIDELNKKQKN